jgi:hypothetical protein
MAINIISVSSTSDCTGPRQISFSDPAGKWQQIAQDGRHDVPELLTPDLPA